MLEVGGRAGVAEAFGGTADVPFYARYYLGGLYDLRGFKYRNIGPRQCRTYPITSLSAATPIWFGSAEYSLPIFEQEHGIGVRFALFFDIGSVGEALQLQPGRLRRQLGHRLADQPAHRPDPPRLRHSDPP